MFCTNCGNQNPDGAKFCFNCGSRLNDSPVYQTPPVQQSAPFQNPAPAKKQTGFGKQVIISLLVFALFYGISYTVASSGNSKQDSGTYRDTTYEENIQIIPVITEPAVDYTYIPVEPVLPELPETGYTADLGGWWEKVYLEDGNFSLNVSALCFSETVYNCTGLTVNMDVTMNAGTNCKDWQVWGRSGNTFVKIAKVYLPAGDGFVSQSITFPSPVTFDAIAVTPTIVGGYSWSMSLSITDVWAD